MLKSVFSNSWVQALGALLGILLLGLLCYILSPVLTPLFFAFLAAYVLDPVVDFFERRRIPRGVTIAVFAVVGLVLLVTVPLFLISNLITEADRLMQAGAAGLKSGAFSAWVNPLLDKLPLADVVSNAGWGPPGLDSADALAAVAEQIGNYVKLNAVRLLQDSVPHVAGAAQVFATMGRRTLGLIEFIANLALFLFVAGYLLKDFDRVIVAARDLIPLRYREHISFTFSKIDAQVHGFLRGQMLVCFFLGLMYAVGFFSSGCPFGIPLGLFGGIASFVPYLGLVLTIVPALLLTLLQHGADWHVLGILITFGFAHLVEGTILTPKIVGEQVGLSPVWVILAIMVFGSFLGFLGLLLAVPIAAALKVLIVEALAYYRASSLFVSSAAAPGGAAAVSGEAGAGADGAAVPRPRKRKTSPSKGPNKT